MWLFHYSYSSCLVSPRLLWLCRAITMIVPRSGSAGKTLKVAIILSARGLDTLYFMDGGG